MNVLNLYLPSDIYDMKNVNHNCVPLPFFLATDTYTHIKWCLAATSRLHISSRFNTAPMYCFAFFPNNENKEK